VEDSRKAMEQFTGEKKNPTFPVMKAGMRLANAVQK
jgi:purine-nucleoside phosphorylase